MQMMEDSLPSIKGFFQDIRLAGAMQAIFTRFMISILMRHGRNSSMNCASVIEESPRHRAQPSRFLQRPSWRAMDVLGQLAGKLLANQSWRDEYILILDSTMIGQQGKTRENTYSTGNRKRRPAKNRRYKTYKYARKACHCFVFGLLLTPDGLRVPFYKPYHTRGYARRKQLTFQTQAQLAADLVRQLPVPSGTSVVVLGDTAFDAKVVRAACDWRGFHWITPCNANRVFAGARGERPRVSSRINQLSKACFKAIRLAQGSSKYAEQRRLSAHRVGSKLKPRTYYVHQERRTVHHVGQVNLVFSSTKPILKQAKRDSTKVLMTNAVEWDARRIALLYNLRWQIELFFKELKSDLGMHQYKYRRFEAVTGWIEIVLTTFLYLEWTRQRKLADRRLSAATRQTWRCQRTYGCRLAVITGAQIRQRKWILRRLKSRSGINTLAKTFTRLLAYEYRCTA